MRYVLVSAPTSEDAQRTVLCQVHLDNALLHAPLGAGEYVFAADDDVECESCAHIRGTK